MQLLQKMKRPGPGSASHVSSSRLTVLAPAAVAAAALAGRCGSGGRFVLRPPPREYAMNGTKSASGDGGVPDGQRYARRPRTDETVSSLGYALSTMRCSMASLINSRSLERGTPRTESSANSNALYLCYSLTQIRRPNPDNLFHPRSLYLL